MAHIQMSDCNPSDLEFIEELTDEELLAINGGIFWEALKGKIKDSIWSRRTITLPVNPTIWPGLSSV